MCFHERTGEGSGSSKMECLPQLCSSATYTVLMHTLKNASVSHASGASLAEEDDLRFHSHLSVLWGTGSHFVVVPASPCSATAVS